MRLQTPIAFYHSKKENLPDWSGRFWQLNKVILPQEFINSLTQIRFQCFAAAGMAQTAYGFFLYLTYTLTGKAEFLAYFFQGHGMLAVQAEIKRNYIGFALGKRT